MKNVVIVDPMSTGYNFVADITRRGCHPVILWTKLREGTKELAALRKADMARLKVPYSVLEEADTYAETLDAVKGLNPVFVLPGTEGGVVLATKLANDLDLKCPPIERLDAMTKKDAMQDALKAAGMRHIRGKRVYSVAEGMDYYDQEGMEAAVVKPLESAGSQGLFLCDKRADVEDALKNLFAMKDIFGRENTCVLVQERIVGTEYIVNTVSCDGEHRITSMLRYDKFRTPEGGYIYNYIETLDALEPGHSVLAEYALRTADAIGVKYGPIHGEYMIDEKGPVLIEVNCRPMGCSMPAEFLNRIFGQHETDSILDCFLDPEKFRLDRETPYRTIGKGYLKIFVVPRDMEAESLPAYVIASQLRSTFRIDMLPENESHTYVKTRDLESNGGIIFLYHEDRHIAEHDLKLLCEIEKMHFSMLINDGMSRPWWFRKADETGEDPRDSVREIIETAGCHGSILVAADEYGEVEGFRMITPDQLTEDDREYRNVIIMLRERYFQKMETEMFREIFDIMKRVQIGGRVIIPSNTYRYWTDGRKGAEVLLQVLGYELQLPLFQKPDIVIGVRS